MGFFSIALLIVLIWYLFVHLEKDCKKTEKELDKKEEQK